MGVRKYVLCDKDGAYAYVETQKNIGNELASLAPHRNAPTFRASALLRLMEGREGVTQYTEGMIKRESRKATRNRQEVRGRGDVMKEKKGTNT